VSTAYLPGRITVSANGQYAYVTHFDAIVSQLSIDASGKLTALTPATVASEDTGTLVATNAAGTLAFVPNTSVASISQYSIANGLLSPLAPASYSLQNDGGTAKVGDIAFDPTGSFVYVANVTENVIHLFSATPSGLVPLTPSTVLSSPGTGRFLIVAKP
jgi:6-phosphogluconolactonase (cycloisomerase 2 family)